MKSIVKAIPTLLELEAMKGHLSAQRRGCGTQRKECVKATWVVGGRTRKAQDSALPAIAFSRTVFFLPNLFSEGLKLKIQVCLAPGTSSCNTLLALVQGTFHSLALEMPLQGGEVELFL